MSVVVIFRTDDSFSFFGRGRCHSYELFDMDKHGEVPGFCKACFDYDFCYPLTLTGFIVGCLKLVLRRLTIKREWLL